MRALTAALVLVSTFGCYERSDCVRGDFTHFIQMDKDTMTVFEVDWLADATVCRVGEYLVYSPANGSSPKLFIRRCPVHR